MPQPLELASLFRLVVIIGEEVVLYVCDRVCGVLSFLSAEMRFLLLAEEPKDSCHVWASRYTEINPCFLPPLPGIAKGARKSY